MLSTLAAIGFDPQIRGILVVGTGAVVLFGSIWLILATNSGIRLASLIALSGFFGWMFIMGGFWWIRGIGYVGESVSWEVLDYNRADISQSSVDRATELPDPELLQGVGFTLIKEAGEAEAQVEAQVEGLEGDELAAALDAAWAEVEDGEDLRFIAADFELELDRDDVDYVDLTDEEFANAVARNDLRNQSTTISQIFSVAPDFVEHIEGTEYEELAGWEIMSTADAGEAQSTAGAAILEQDGFDFDSQAQFRFLDAFHVGGKPRLHRGIDPDCTFCTDNLRRGWHWISNAARIKNPPEYSVIQLRAVDAEALIVEEGQAPPFPTVDEDAPIISVVMIRDLGNLRFPPAMVTLGSLLIFTALVYMLHLRDLETMRRVEEFEAEA